MAISLRGPPELNGKGPNDEDIKDLGCRKQKQSSNRAGRLLIMVPAVVIQLLGEESTVVF